MDWPCGQCTLVNGVPPDSAGAVAGPYPAFEAFAKFKGDIIREGLGALVECAACDAARGWNCRVPLW